MMWIDKMQGKKLLITGGGGFIGTSLIEGLLKEGFEITNAGLHKAVDPSVTNIEVDFEGGDFSFMDNAGFEYVIHLAALAHETLCKDWDKTIKINVEATEKLLKKCKGVGGVKKIIFASSSLIYDSGQKMPLTEMSRIQKDHGNYLKSKVLAEEICQRYINAGMPVIIFRIVNLYGPNFGPKTATLVPQLVRQGVLERKITVRNGNPIRDWVYVEDVVDAYCKALDSSFSGVVNISSGTGTSAAEIGKIIAQLTSADIVIGKEDVGGPPVIVCDNTLAKKSLGWSPNTKINEGLKKTVDYFKTYSKR